MQSSAMQPRELGEFDYNFDDLPQDPACDCAVVGFEWFFASLCGRRGPLPGVPPPPPLEDKRKFTREEPLEPSSVTSFDRYQQQQQAHTPHELDPNRPTQAPRQSSRLFSADRRRSTDNPAFVAGPQPPSLGRQRVKSEGARLDSLQRMSTARSPRGDGRAGGTGGIRRNVSFGSTNAMLRIESRQDLAESLKEHLWYDSRNISGFVMEELQRRKAVGITSTSALCANQVEVGSH